MTSVDVVRLGPDHAHALATLLAEHVQERRGGSPPRPDRYWAEQLLCQPRIELFGARLDGELIGVAVVHELTDCLTGRETGLLETLFVRPPALASTADANVADPPARSPRRHDANATLLDPAVPARRRTPAMHRRRRAAPTGTRRRRTMPALSGGRPDGTEQKGGRDQSVESLFVEERHGPLPRLEAGDGGDRREPRRRRAASSATLRPRTPRVGSTTTRRS